MIVLTIIVAFPIYNIARDSRVIHPSIVDMPRRALVDNMHPSRFPGWLDFVTQITG